MKFPARIATLALFLSAVQVSYAAVETFDIATFIRPAGWIRKDTNGVLLLEDQKVVQGRLRPASAVLADDAIGTFRQLFKADPLSSYPSPPPNLARGISAQGWEYFEIKKLVGGQEGDARTMGAIVLDVRVGDEIATVIGTSKDFMQSQCFGLLQPDSWPAFFHSLQFRDTSLTGQSQAAIRQQLAGTWLAATSSVGVGYVFMANGRYGSIGAVRHYDTQTQEFYGDGSYSFDGPRLVLTGNDQRRTVYWFRLQQVSRNSGQSWQEALCLLPPDGTHELCYRKG